MPILLLALSCTSEEGSPKDTVTDDPTGDTPPSTPQGQWTDQWSDGTWTTTVSVERGETLTRTYRFSTDHPQRDGGPQQVVVEEVAGQVVLRSGRLMLDGLFALAIQEARQNSVSQIQDGAFAGGAPIPCECFQTGALWPWVWTRDTAFAADLGLAWLDPTRTAASLRFKVSQGKPGSGLVGRFVVQDTGTGGSWPVSTDRVVWALGARAVLDALPLGPERDAFAEEALAALIGTLEQDRAHTYDPADGLYRGETSFLDWREQSYPVWTAQDAARIAETKALSTNLLHLHALELATELAPPGEAERYARWADELRDALQAFRTEEGWASFLGGPLDFGPGSARDLLGTSLAALWLEDEPAATVAGWPQGRWGPPVIWPGRPEPAIYHNRATWPFVSAYQLRAARKAGDDAVVGHLATGMIRAAALNLTNPENLEWASGEPFVEDGDRSGPVVNSPAQLWSIAAFLALVTDGLFGMERHGGEVSFAPLLPAALRDEWLGDEVVLHGLPLRGEPHEVRLVLPPAGSTGHALVAADEVRASGSITLTLSPRAEPPRALEIAEDRLSPSTPGLSVSSAAQGAVLTFSGDPGVRWNVWKDGALLAEDLAETSFTDPTPPGQSAPCYAIEAVDPQTGLRSHRSAPICDWGAGAPRVQVLDAWWLVGGGRFATDHGRPHIANWGAPEDALEATFRPSYSGEHLIQPVFANGNGPVNTGITAGHVWLRLERAQDGALVSEGPLVLPHTGAWDQWRDGTALRASLDRQSLYRLRLTVLPNGSALQAYSAYGGAGGGSERTGWVDLAELKLLALDGPGAPPAGDHVALDGTDDVGAFSAEHQLAPGIGLADWSRFALDHDGDYLYLALASPAFEADFTPLVLYLQVDPASAPVPGSGFEYSGLVPSLPFTPTHAITARAISDAGDGIGPWNAVWVPDGQGFRMVGRLADGVATHLAADRHTLSLRIPAAWLGAPERVRLVAHVVHALPGEEWKEVVPAGHTPWVAGGGSYYEFALGAPVGEWAIGP